MSKLSEIQENLKDKRRPSYLPADLSDVPPEQFELFAALVKVYYKQLSTGVTGEFQLKSSTFKPEQRQYLSTTRGLLFEVKPGEVQYVDGVKVWSIPRYRLIPFDDLRGDVKECVLTYIEMRAEEAASKRGNNK